MALRLATSRGSHTCRSGHWRLWLAPLLVGLGSLLAGCAQGPERLTVRASSPELESPAADDRPAFAADSTDRGTARVEATPTTAARPGTARIRSRVVAPATGPAANRSAASQSTTPTPPQAPSAVAVASARRRVVDAAPSTTAPSGPATGPAPRTRSRQSARTVVTQAPQSAPPTPRVTATQRTPAHTSLSGANPSASARPTATASDTVSVPPEEAVIAGLPAATVEPTIQPVAGEGSGTAAEHESSDTADASATGAAATAAEPGASDSQELETSPTETIDAGATPARKRAAEATDSNALRQASPAPRSVPRIAVVDPQVAEQAANEQRAVAEGYRQRADRLLDRARRQWEAGHREEALRLAQIAHRLELAQKALYRPDEESPSRFIATLQTATIGETLPRPPAATGPAYTQDAGPGSAATENPGAEIANQPPTDTPATAATNPAEVSLDAVETPTVANSPAVDQLTESRRFHRSAHRQPTAGEPTVVPSDAALAEFERLAELAASPATEGNDIDTAPDAPAPAEAAAPELRDLPLELSNAATTTRGLTWLSPRVRWWLTWNRLSFLGLMTGLACLLMLWVWRELERWHHRGLQRAELAG